MGKYTSIARILRNELEDAESREYKGSSQNNIYGNINNIDESIDSNLVDESSGSMTTLRPTTLTTLIPDEKDEIDEKALVICIHNVEQETCAVCSGYVRWLVEDDVRLSAARSNPEATRRQYRKTLEGGKS
jgi:hypothetical protein